MVAALTEEGQRILEAAVYAFDTDEAIVQITAIVITIEYPHNTGLPYYFSIDIKCRFSYTFSQQKQYLIKRRYARQKM
jgi:hypothetical protein